LKGDSGGLYEAIETGTVDLNDDTLRQRVHKLKASKEAVLIELANARAKQHQPTARILPSHLDAFSQALRRRLRDRRPDFAKRYLNILVDKIVINASAASIRGG
jgi:hypothetical protein